MPAPKPSPKPDDVMRPLDDPNGLAMSRSDFDTLYKRYEDETDMMAKCELAVQLAPYCVKPVPEKVLTKRQTETYLRQMKAWQEGKRKHAPVVK